MKSNRHPISPENRMRLGCRVEVAQEGNRELKGIDPDARVIVSSGYSGDPVMSEFREYGFVVVVRKPYSIEDLGKVLIE